MALCVRAQRLIENESTEQMARDWQKNLRVKRLIRQREAASEVTDGMASAFEEERRELKERLRLFVVENVLLGADGKFKLLDFGSWSDECSDTASLDKHAISALQEHIERYTTMMYRPPEMVDFFNQFVISEKVDIWMLGCILFTLMFYRHPFQDESALAIANARYNFPEAAIWWVVEQRAQEQGATIAKEEIEKAIKKEKERLKRIQLAHDSKTLQDDVWAKAIESSPAKSLLKKRRTSVDEGDEDEKEEGKNSSSSSGSTGKPSLGDPCPDCTWQF
ncbi:unnamed protein product [Polarella glacialis]|uniref:non-specific serine/threonine protein kinase n=1 Tax=Polarella glacialis TaxID=89957 RepID=A0A813GLN1_POLGL|nr:unnamed protein product [Polarella glacialis]